MLNQKRTIFRKESLERLSSPERLDQLMQVVSLKSWLPLTTLGCLVGAAVIWSIYGRIPITVEGRGVLVYPHKVVPIESKTSGQILSLNISVGDVIKKGDIIATIDQVELRNQLQLLRARLGELEKQHLKASSLEMKRKQMDKKAIQEQRQNLLQKLSILRNMTPILKEKGLIAIQRDRQNLQQRLRVLRDLTPNFKKRWLNRQMLLREGAVTEDVVIQSRQDYLNNIGDINDVEFQLKQLDVKEADTKRQYLENLNEIKNIQAQLQEQNTKEANLAQQDLTTLNTRKNQIQDVKLEIAKLEQQIANNSQIISQYSGRVLEIILNPGEFVSSGTRVATMDVENTASSKLVGITYFSIKDGKKIQKGMTVQITPETVKRERFGGIVGTVTDVSPFPITKEAAYNLIGNPEVVSSLISQKQEGLMQISSELLLDPKTFSGYRWSSSSGPRQKISPGTTTIVRVKVDERAPITFVIPILRSYSGIF
jgi:HlyD family secretion protein